MPARRRSRQRALQVLFQWDSRKQSIDEAIESFYLTLYSAEDEPGHVDTPPPPDPFMESLARGTAANFAEIDDLIAKRAENWRLDRMPIVDRNILRMAVYEMRDLGTPPGRRHRRSPRSRPPLLRRRSSPLHQRSARRRSQNPPS